MSTQCDFQGTVKSRVSIVLLTYNRPAELQRNIHELSQLQYPNLEIIVVDNCSALKAAATLSQYPNVCLIELDSNQGVAGRNIGIEAASGEIIVTLDDDVFGFSDAAIEQLFELFQDPTIGAVNFKIIDDKTEALLDWVHKRRIEEYVDQTFETFEISEGAVAFRREVVLQAGLYPEYFFISHEGPDLALRIMDLGKRVIYSPEILVRHAHAEGGRKHWRRYYFDTRNQLWLVLRLFPWHLGLKKLALGWAAMFAYALKDGYTRYWFKAVYDGLRGWRRAKDSRRTLSPETWCRYREIEAYNPSIAYLIKTRLKRQVIR